MNHGEGRRRLLSKKHFFPQGAAQSKKRALLIGHHGSGNRRGNFNLAENSQEEQITLDEETRKNGLWLGYIEWPWMKRGTWEITAAKGGKRKTPSTFHFKVQ